MNIWLQNFPLYRIQWKLNHNFKHFSHWNSTIRSLLYPCNICILIFDRATEEEKQLNEIITEKHYLTASSISLTPIIENINEIALIAILVQTVISISTSYYSFFHLDLKKKKKKKKKLSPKQWKCVTINWCNDPISG